MNAQLTSHMLNFKYEKPSGEISRKAAAKADELEAKAVGRVSKLREEYGITDAMLADLLRQVRETQRAGGVTSGGRIYTVSNASGLALGNGTAARQESSGPGEVVVGAGVLNHLLTEGDLIEAERRDARRLRTIARNIADLPDDRPGASPGSKRGHELTREELDYLGF